MIKKILISIGITVIAAGVAIGALYLVKLAQPAPAAKVSASKTLILDHSKDYGACTLLTTSSIKTALGDTATNLQAQENVGITRDNYFGNGVQNIVSDSQTCIYAFAPGSNARNTLDATNGFTVKKTVFTNKDGPKELINQTKLDPSKTVINSLGDIAFYSANNVAQGPGATYNFELQIFKSNESTSYTISQPAKNSTFTADTAKTALLALAASAK
jgi:hypothetical protein